MVFIAGFECKINFSTGKNKFFQCTEGTDDIKSATNVFLSFHDNEEVKTNNQNYKICIHILTKCNFK